MIFLELVSPTAVTDITEKPKNLDRSSKRFLGFMNACFRGDSNLRLASPRIFENLAAIDTIAGNLTHKSYQKASISNHLNLLQVTGIQSSKAVFCHFG